MDPSIAQRFSKYLAPRETVRWTGRPVQGFAFQLGDLTNIPFSLLWLGFAIFWTAGVTSSGAPSFFWLFGGFFVVVGLQFAFGRYFTDAFVRGRTFYALTDARALVLTGWRGNTLMAVDLRGVSEINLIPSSGDRGTIVFGPPNHYGISWKQEQVTRARSQEFVKIERVDETYALIQRLRTQPLPA